MLVMDNTCSHSILFHFSWKKVMENTCNQSIPSLLFAIKAKRFPTNKSYPPWKFPKHVKKYLYCAIFSGIQTQIMHMAFKISFPYNTFQMNGISLVCLETCISYLPVLSLYGIVFFLYTYIDFLLYIDCLWNEIGISVAPIVLLIFHFHRLQSHCTSFLLFSSEELVISHQEFSSEAIGIASNC